MSMNARKLSRYLGELESIYQQSVNLTINYDNALSIISQSRNDTREFGLDRNYINVTENQLFLNNPQLMLHLEMLRNRIGSFKNRILTEQDHMPILVLGEELTQWSDQYTALVVAPAMNVISHIQDKYNFLTISQNNGVAYV